MEQTNGNLALLPMRQQPPAEWDTAEKLALLRDTYARGLSQSEFELFIEHCRQIGLNPLTKQVQPVKFDGKTLSFHTTIHGLVAIASRTGRYAGIDDVEFDIEPKGDALGNQHPNWARATVYFLVQGQLRYAKATVRWLERNRGQASWKVQPWHMLGKCAMAAAFRLAFEETRGLYIEEELPPAHVVESTAQRQSSYTPSAPAGQEPPASPPTGMTWAQWCGELAKRTNPPMTKDQYFEIVGGITGKNPTTQAKQFKDADWQKVAHELLSISDAQQADLQAGLEEEDAGLAKMAGLDHQAEAEA